MREVVFNIRSKHSVNQFSMTEFGRITCQEPFFTASLSQLRTIKLLAQGLSFSEIGSLINRKEGYLREQIKRALKSNKVHQYVQLVATAAELGLFTDLAEQEIEMRKKEIVKKIIRIQVEA